MMSFFMFILSLGVVDLLFDAKQLGCGLENHAVNHLFGQMHFVEPDTTAIASFGLLHGNVEPVLLFDGIAAAFVVAGLVGLVVLFAVGVVKSFTKQNTACRAARDGDGIAFGKNTADGRAACTQAYISGSSGYGGAAREQTHNTGKGNESNE
jgi:hypothetical protein